MAKYEKPKCTCGKELEFKQSIIYNHVQDINNDGKLSKRIKKYYWGDYGTEWLQCKDSSCNLSFHMEFDDNDRVIRGEIYDI